jgi:hypothetical protein
MGSHLLTANSYGPTLITLLLFCASINGQSTGSIEGQITDQNGAVVVAAQIRASSRGILVDRSTVTDNAGRYQMSALPVGPYRLEVTAKGFQTLVIDSLRVEVAKRTTQNIQLHVGALSEQVTVSSTNGLIEATTISVGQVTDGRMVQELPLNGRFFLDLGLLAPGSVTPPQNGFSTAPVRGSGAFAINTAGNREDAVNYMINGITLNNQWFSSISFQPSINTVQEFKIDNSTFSAEYGQSSGAVVNVATRSGANEFHGELFEFFRNDAVDARNYFDFTSQPPPFKRNQFGGNLGGPIVKNKAFFFFSYEGTRQRQRLSLNSLVLSNAERASATDPVIVRLMELIPRSNFVDSSGTQRFVSSATAPVNLDQWTIDVSYNVGKNDRLHAYYAAQPRNFIEPSRFGNTIPGFGNKHHSLRQLLTLNEIHTFSPTLVNEARLGFNRIFGLDLPNAQLNPAEFGIADGITESTGLPQINVAGGGLNFGGPALFPSGRGDTTFVIADTLNMMKRQHTLKIGGEFRQFFNNNIRVGSGTFNFPTLADFLEGTANSFSITIGDQASSIRQNALGFFVQDNYKWRSNLTFELGLRYDWNMTPTERYDRFVVFDPLSVSLLRVGHQIDEIYHQNNKNFQPRVGFAWDPKANGKTSIRGAYAILVDEPLTSVASGRSANPPFATPLTFSGPIRLDSAFNRALPAGLAPQTVDHGFDNAYLQSWNLNVQHELTTQLALMIGYFGSKGTHLTLRRNINQPVDGVRPFRTLSASSPILPGVPLGNITQAESTGNSSYNAVWVTANQRFSHGLECSVSYTWSKSIDYNSRSLQDVVVQDSYNLRGDRGLSDFDARHRFVLSTIYELPFRGNRFVDGWQLAAIVQAQSGNPVNIVTSDSSVTGVANTLRPDVTGPVTIIGGVERWFDISAFTPVPTFGNLGRNVIIGPRFDNTDVSIMKTTKVGDELRLQFRLEIFDVFNHANFGQPGNVVGSPGFGRIINTRFPTGEAGSSRQLQFALKALF